MALSRIVLTEAKDIEATFGELCFMGATERQVYDNGQKTDKIYYVVNLASKVCGSAIEVRVPDTMKAAIEQMSFLAPVTVKNVEITARGTSQVDSTFASVIFTIKADTILSARPVGQDLKPGNAPKQ